MLTRQTCWRKLREDLPGAGISVVRPNELNDAERDWLLSYFLDQVFPILTPLAVDPAHPFLFF